MNCQGYRPYANTRRGTDRVPNYMHPTFPWLYNTSKGGKKKKSKATSILFKLAHLGNAG